VRPAVAVDVSEKVPGASVEAKALGTTPVNADAKLEAAATPKMITVRMI
jgi:hypothetical protein